MATYMISDITVRDRTAFEIYRTRAADAIHTYGGRYLARLGEVQALEGSWNPNMIVIVEFPNLDRGIGRATRVIGNSLLRFRNVSSVLFC